MILDSISLENFGIYGGYQKAELTPEPGKPIILFGGMNGGGKTTLLDAVQLVLYGQKARISNRGKINYRDYLRDSIHRGSDPTAGASINLCFRRMLEGKSRNFELRRSWREGSKGIEESVQVWCDGKLDSLFTDHWDEVIETYIPNGIAHLFFFDGEQIKELAEGEHAAKILGTAINSLLGLDLVERLEADLKAFERRKRSEKAEDEESKKLSQIDLDFQQVDLEESKACDERGFLTNESGRIAKDLNEKEEEFLKEGGELFVRRNEIEKELEKLRKNKQEIESHIRDLITGAFPLILIENLLKEVEQQAIKEKKIRHTQILNESLSVRDAELLKNLNDLKVDEQAVATVKKLLEVDRGTRSSLNDEMIVLDADNDLDVRINHLRNEILPSNKIRLEAWIEFLSNLEEKIFRLESELERVPTAERIVDLQKELEVLREAHRAKKIEIEQVNIKIQALQKQKSLLQENYKKIENQNMDLRFAEDDRQRMIKHSRRVRNTLDSFRSKVILRHTKNMESLMLESFQSLLRKVDLVSDLIIDPNSFEASLIGRDGKKLPFDRLSAGERQLLATSMLWGLARASGRPMPTIIDTPLGRLDSSHRRHLVQRYFPSASHQVLLLSTDEEIIGESYESLKPYISRTYLLNHDEKLGQTNIEHGYFIQHETTS